MQGFLSNIKAKFAKKGNSEEELDRNVEEEIARNLWANHRMLPPESKFKRWWNRVMIALVIYNAFFIPYILGYSRYDPTRGNLYFYDLEADKLYIFVLLFDYAVDIFFVCDMLLTFRTTFFDQDNELVLDKKLIKELYYKGAFKLDLYATIPFELIGLCQSKPKLFLRLKVLRLLRLMKVVRQIDVHNNVLRVLEMLGFFLLFAHVVGSLWWAIGVASFNRNDEDEMFGRPRGSSWVIRSHVCYPEDAYPPRNGSSIDMYCSSESIEMRLMSATYWSLTALIKTPWVHPDTVIEKAFATLNVVVGAVVFAAILGNITAMINSFDKSNAQLREVMATLNRLIGKYEVPSKLQKRVFMYVQTQWATTKGLKTNQILAKMPPALRGDILEAIYADVVQNSAMFSRVSQECVRVMLGKLRGEMCLPKETLLNSSQICNEVFVLQRGVLQVQPGDSGGGKKGGAKGKMLFRAIEKTGALVGMRDPFEKDYRYPFIVIAIKQAHLVALTGKDLLEVFAMDNRADIEAICEVLDKEYSDIEAALLKGQEGIAARRSSTSRQSRRRSSQGNSDASQLATASATLSNPMSDPDEVHLRLGAIEDSVRAATSEIAGIKTHLANLPQLCDILDIPYKTVNGLAVPV